MPELLDYISADERRAQAARLLPTIADDVRTALYEADIKHDICFIVLSSGNAILQFGTATEPDDGQWEEISKIVCAVVGQALQMEHVTSRDLACAIAHSAVPGPKNAVDCKPDR